MISDKSNMNHILTLFKTGKIQFLRKILYPKKQHLDDVLYNFSLICGGGLRPSGSKLVYEDGYLWGSVTTIHFQYILNLLLPVNSLLPWSFASAMPPVQNVVLKSISGEPFLADCLIP